MEKPPEPTEAKLCNSAVADASTPWGAGEGGALQAGRTGRGGLSNAENMLAVIFIILSVPVPLDDAKEMFSLQGGFEKRLKLVNFMVTRANRASEIEVWAKIYKGAEHSPRCAQPRSSSTCIDGNVRRGPVC